MANVKFPRDEFEKAIGRKITKELEEKIHLFGTPLESLTKEEIEIEIFPDRPDLLSMQGFVRSFKTFLGRPLQEKYKINKPEKDYSVKVDKSVKDVRPFTVCAIIKNLKLDDQKIKDLVEIQEKLHSTLGRNRKKSAIGVYPLEKIKLPIKYEAKKPGDIKFIPLEEEREMTASQILKKHPKGKDYANLLKGSSKYPLFIDAKGSVLSMPPIINSHETGKVTEKTKEVFIECSGFDKNTLNKTLNILVAHFSDIGGKIYAMNILDKTKEITPNLEPQKTKISKENINKLLGLNLKEMEIEKLLKKMGHEYNAKTCTVSTPAWRTDILHEVDITEDIAIAYGYDKFIPEIPDVATIGEESGHSKLKRKISETLTGLGLIETSSYHLVKPNEIKKSGLKEIIELEDSKTEYKSLRPNLLIPTLRILSENKDNEYPQRIFEIGKIFAKDSKEETGIKEQTNLLIALSHSSVNFTHIKQFLDCLFRTLELNYVLKESSKPELIEGRAGTIVLNKKDIGTIGEVHPLTLKSWSLKMPLAVIELNLDEILREIN